MQKKRLNTPLAFLRVLQTKHDQKRTNGNPVLAVTMKSTFSSTLQQSGRGYNPFR